MGITILATLMIMAAYFLILYGAVGFIQNKRFFLPRRKKIWRPFPIKRRGSPARMSSAGS